MSDNIEEARMQAQRVLKEMVHAYFKFPKLLIAVVNGPCIGIAATTAALCDVVYASDTVSGIISFSFLSIHSITVF